MTPSFSDYLNSTIKHSKNDLNNPRHSFNSGYHDNEMEFNHNWNRPDDINNHFDPYYKAGYFARVDERKQGIEYKGNSNNAWSKWIVSLSKFDKKTVEVSITESTIIGKEYLFSKKQSRKTFSLSQWDQIYDYVISVMCEG
jgi:hypothetical protein